MIAQDGYDHVTKGKKALKVTILSGDDPWLVPRVARRLKKLGYDVELMRVTSMNKENNKGLYILRRIGLLGTIKVALSILKTKLFDNQFTRIKKSDIADISTSRKFIFLINYPYIIKTDEISGEVLNCHTSILPKYPGLLPITRAWDDGNFEAIGSTIHKVTKKIDAGEILWSRICPRQSNIYDYYISVYEAFAEGIDEFVSKQKT
jgi:folate-dependent phosphoribosylglycinamide formyltransferase PurN